MKNGDDRSDWLLPRLPHPEGAMLTNVQLPPQASGGEPCPLPLSSLHPPPLQWKMMQRLHLLGSLSSSQNPYGQTQPDSLLLMLTARPGLGAFLLPFLHFWKFYQLKCHHLQAVSLDFPSHISCSIHEDLRVFVCLLKVWGPGGWGLAGPPAHPALDAPSLPQPLYMRFQNKGPEAIKTQLNFSLL